MLIFPDCVNKSESQDTGYNPFSTDDGCDKWGPQKNATGKLFDSDLTIYYSNIGKVMFTLLEVLVFGNFRVFRDTMDTSPAMGFVMVYFFEIFFWFFSFF